MTEFWPGEFRFCPMCATALQATERGGRTRMACPGCGYVHFRDPGVGAAVLLEDGAGRVLLVQRGSSATKAGLWCVPCGYVDYGEEVRAAAAREVREETGLEVEVGDPVFVSSNFHDPEKLTVGIWFAGRIVGGVAEAGDDAVDVGWFEPGDLPPLAFETDAELFRVRFGVDARLG
ncbi:MAG TPA: NUDIX domain-containing protein [Acidimicrobiia bacterium]|nr:NUDIX domain-containing protein [Acidimicrobiia bacterium]